MFKIIKFVCFDLVDNNKEFLDNIKNTFGNISNSSIAENNIEIAKQMDNIKFLCSSIVGWLNANTDKNLLDLEKKFRFLNNGIYLIPRESNDEKSEFLEDSDSSDDSSSSESESSSSESESSTSSDSDED